MDLAVLAGILSTGLFAMSYLPMLVKAARTKDLSSYSFGNLAITNAGNALYSVYVFSLPVGPIWFLHTFYLVASALMLFWFLRCRAAWERRGANSVEHEDRHDAPGRTRRQREVLVDRQCPLRDVRHHDAGSGCAGREPRRSQAARHRRNQNSISADATR